MFNLLRLNCLAVPQINLMHVRANKTTQLQCISLPLNAIVLTTQDSIQQCDFEHCAVIAAHFIFPGKKKNIKMSTVQQKSMPAKSENREHTFH